MPYHADMAAAGRVNLVVKLALDERNEGWTLRVDPSGGQLLCDLLQLVRARIVDFELVGLRRVDRLLHLIGGAADALVQHMAASTGRPELLVIAVGKRENTP